MDLPVSTAVDVAVRATRTPTVTTPCSTAVKVRTKASEMPGSAGPDSVGGGSVNCLRPPLASCPSAPQRCPPQPPPLASEPARFTDGQVRPPSPLAAKIWSGVTPSGKCHAVEGVSPFADVPDWWGDASLSGMGWHPPPRPLVAKIWLGVTPSRPCRSFFWWGSTYAGVPDQWWDASLRGEHIFPSGSPLLYVGGGG